jgi:hypothetical protein
MDQRIKKLVEQAGLKIEEDGDDWVFVTDKNFFEKFAELVRQDERKQLNGVTAHEQMLMDGQQSLLKGKKWTSD